jgi:hypothetical protein
MYPEIVFTREHYVKHICTHEQYYTQFVTKGIMDIVSATIGLDKITASKSKFFNDLPLASWDTCLPRNMFAINELLNAAGDHPTIAGMTCIAKQAARMIKSEFEKEHNKQKE